MSCAPNGVDICTGVPKPPPNPGWFNRTLVSAVEAHGGAVVKYTGDGVLADFTAASDAVAAAAAAAQRGLGQAAWGGDPVTVRMGLHSGEAPEVFHSPGQRMQAPRRFMCPRFSARQDTRNPLTSTLASTIPVMCPSTADPGTDSCATPPAERGAVHGTRRTGR
jgi:hypothetical protein